MGRVLSPMLAFFSLAGLWNTSYVYFGFCFYFKINMYLCMVESNVSVKVLQCLIVGDFLYYLHILFEESVIGVLKHDSGLFFQLEHVEILNVLSHQVSGSSHWTLVGYGTVSHWCCIGHCPVSRTHVFLKVFFEAWYFLVRLWFGHSFFDTFRDQLAEHEFGFLFSCFDLSFSQGCSSVLWNFLLHFLNLLLSEVFLLLYILILVSDLGLLVRECLLPCWFDKTEELVIGFFLLCKFELVSFRNRLNASENWCCNSHLFFINLRRWN